MGLDYYTPTVDEFKETFKAFAYNDDPRYQDSNDVSIINVEYLKKLLDGKALEVKRVLNNKGYPEPSDDDNSPVFNIKKYILFEVAKMFTANYATNTDLINWIREEALRAEEAFNNDLSSILTLPSDYDSVPLCGDVPKQ